MTAKDCEVRALKCAENAALAVNAPVAEEFMKLAAQWRAMGSRLLYLGPVDATSAERRTFLPED